MHSFKQAGIQQDLDHVEKQITELEEKRKELKVSLNRAEHSLLLKNLRLIPKAGETLEPMKFGAAIVIDHARVSFCGNGSTKYAMSIFVSQHNLTLAGLKSCTARIEEIIESCAKLSDISVVNLDEMLNNG